MVIKLTVDGDKYDIGEDLRSRIENKFGDLDQYLNSLVRGHVSVAWEDGNEQTSVRAQVWGPGHRFEASDTDRAATAAVDTTHRKLETQIRREHGKEISERDR